MGFHTGMKGEALYRRFADTIFSYIAPGKRLSVKVTLLAGLSGGNKEKNRQKKKLNTATTFYYRFKQIKMDVDVADTTSQSFSEE